MPTEYDYERECNEIDETMGSHGDKQLDEFMERIIMEPKKENKEIEHKGNICCEGCYMLGLKDKQKEMLDIINKDIRWYEEWDNDKNEKDADIKIQVKALLKYCKELKQKLQGAKE